jgi:uncharacterized protein
MDRRAHTGPAQEPHSGPPAGFLNPSTYGSPDVVACHETHASWVFLSGPWAFKVKKPVRLAFLDYSTLALRRAACREEVRVNRELGGDIYVGVRALVPAGSGFALADEHDPRAVEYAVQMRRFDEAATMKGLIEAGELSEARLHDVAIRLARFHASSPVTSGGEPAQLLARWQQNLAELERLVEPSAWRIQLACEFAHAFLAAHADEITMRLRDGRVRDCHGDLRCEHVLLDGGVRVVDRIEFDPRLRRLDVGADLAFLLMDMEAMGHRDGAGCLLREYRVAGGRPGADTLLAFHAAYWALVRAKVAVIAAPSQPIRGREALTLRSLAERLCWRARGALAVIVCGPAASGKSTLARELATRSGLAVVASDEVRKRLAGLGAGERASSEHYTPEFTARTYAAVGEAARARLAGRDGVIVDATCRSVEQRAVLWHAIAGVSDQVLLVHCSVSLQTALRRARARLSDPERVSDATPAIAAAQHEQFEPPAELPADAVLRLDCEQPPGRQAEELTRTLDRRMAGRGAIAST